MNSKPILDMCCGSRMFWVNKQDPRAIFVDNRNESHTLCDGRPLHIHPDVIADFRNLPFSDESFWQVVFDPPHLVNVGESSWLGKKYGRLSRETWKEDLTKGFAEAFRILKTNGTLIFKWNETQIPAKKIIALTDESPAVWQRTGKSDKTHWIIFHKK